MITSFSFAKTPRVLFGTGQISALPDEIQKIGKSVLFVTGGRSFTSSQAWIELNERLSREQITVQQLAIDREPTPSMIDEAVASSADFRPDLVVAIGGGSALDAGKAISAMLPLRMPVKNFLEGVGISQHPGTKVPFIAVPTTAGTGSEATKNSVLSETGENGFKRSLRHDNFVPDIAIIDPSLAERCPRSVTAASGMDAFTQLLESYLSTKANAVTDALALEGLMRVASSLKIAWNEGTNTGARSNMALAAYLSGVTLANAGLGLVHGFAASIGGFFDIPHGVICSRMMAPCNVITLRRLRASRNAALEKYARAGRSFCTSGGKSDDYYIDALLDTIARWTSEMQIPALATFGMRETDFEKIAAMTDNKNNPAQLDKQEIIEALYLEARV